jgi:hypothetical protein
MKKLMVIMVVCVHLIGTSGWACVVVVDDGQCGIPQQTGIFPECIPYAGAEGNCWTEIVSPTNRSHIKQVESGGFLSGYDENVDQIATWEFYTVNTDGDGKCVSCGASFYQFVLPTYFSCTVGLITGGLCTNG